MRQKRSFRRVSLIARFLVLTVLAIIFALPILIMVFTALKEPFEMFTNPGLIPKSWRWQNFVDIWKETNLVIFFKNSLIVTMLSVSIVVFVASFGAYAFSRLKFVGSKVLFLLVLTGLMLPIHACVIPLFKITKSLGLLNNYFALVGPYAAFGIPMCIFILKNFFDTIPKEIEDAAIIDGCSPYRVYWQIFLPLSRPALATVIIWQFLQSWNEYLLALLFMTKDEIKPISLAPQLYQSQTLVAFEKMFALLTIMSIPILVIYFVFQKQFVKGLTSGAIK